MYCILLEPTIDLNGKDVIKMGRKSYRGFIIYGTKICVSVKLGGWDRFFDKYHNCIEMCLENVCSQRGFSHWTATCG